MPAAFPGYGLIRVATKRTSVAWPWEGLPDSCVYVVEAVGADRVKIGLSHGTAEDRIAGLQTSSAFELRTLVVIPSADREFERETHERFASCRLRGEWFEFTPELRAWVERMKLIVRAVEREAEAYVSGLGI